MANDKKYPQKTTHKYHKEELFSWKIAEDLAVIILAGPHKRYYMCEEEVKLGQIFVNKYESIITKTDNLIDDICDGKVSTTQRYRDFYTEWVKLALPDKIYHYIVEKQYQLNEILNGKLIFESPNRLAYVSAIIIRSLPEYIVKEKPFETQQDMIMKPVEFDYSEYQPKLTTRKLRRSLEDLEDNYNESE